MNDGLYKMILSDVKKNLDETTQPVLRADIKKMSSKQICFNALTEEQLYFLEQLAEKQEEPRKTK